MSLGTSSWPLRILVGVIGLGLFGGELYVVARRRGIPFRSLLTHESWQTLAPPLAAVRSQIGDPKTLEYVAATDLPGNHQLQPADLTLPPQESSLRKYFPPLNSRVGFYLCTRVAAGEPILDTNLSKIPLVPPDPKTCLLVLRMERAPGASPFPPATEVTVSLKADAKTTVNATVLHTSQETAADPPKKAESTTPPSSDHH